jgi:hypothetical protein
MKPVAPVMKIDLPLKNSGIPGFISIDSSIRPSSSNCSLKNNTIIKTLQCGNDASRFPHLFM